MPFGFFNGSAFLALILTIIASIKMIPMQSKEENKEPTVSSLQSEGEANKSSNSLDVSTYFSPFFSINANIIKQIKPKNDAKNVENILNICKSYT